MSIYENCGTEAGYKKHRYNKTEQCQPCRDAHNEWRRDYHKRHPGKHTLYGRRYKAKNPEKVQAKQRMDPEVKAARAAARHEAALARQAEAKAAKKAARQAKLDKQMAETAKRQEKAKERRIKAVAAAKKAREKEAAKARVAKEAARKAALVAKKQEQAKARVELKARLAIQKAERAAQRAIEAEELKNQHGTLIGDYSRCRRLNGVACEPCKAIAAKYGRERPKEKKKRYNQQTDKNRRRYARENGRKSYTRVSILERDDYTCHLCGERVDTSAPHDNRSPGWERYPHLDHVIPLSKGGSDTPDNVKTAHARCNIDKRDSVA